MLFAGDGMRDEPDAAFAGRIWFAMADSRKDIFRASSSIGTGFGLPDSEWPLHSSCCDPFDLTEESSTPNVEQFWL